LSFVRCWFCLRWRCLSWFLFISSHMFSHRPNKVTSSLSFNIPQSQKRLGFCFFICRSGMNSILKWKEKPIEMFNCLCLF
jgi:hypothetical protein